MSDLPRVAWLCIAFVCVFVSATVIVNVWVRRVYRRLASERQGESFETFLAACDPGVDPKLARRVYKEVEAEVNGKFPLRPGDRFVEDLKLDGEDVAYFIEELFCKMRRKIPKELATPVSTVGDLVSLRQGSPPS